MQIEVKSMCENEVEILQLRSEFQNLINSLNHICKEDIEYSFTITNKTSGESSITVNRIIKSE